MQSSLVSLVLWDSMLWPADWDHPHPAELLAVCQIQTITAVGYKHGKAFWSLAFLVFAPLFLHLPTGVVGMVTGMSSRLAVKEVEESSFITEGI